MDIDYSNPDNLRRRDELVAYITLGLRTYGHNAQISLIMSMIIEAEVSRHRIDLPALREYVRQLTEW